MTAQGKAKELFDKYCYAIRTEERDSGYFTNVIYAKKCALIAVNEILKLNHPYVIVYESFKDNVMENMTQKHYWQEVKQELEKL
jgi:hypothetical protein